MSVLKNQLSRTFAPWIFRATGTDIFTPARWLAESERWTPEARAAWRLERLNATLRFCWEHVPFYREYWGDHGVRTGDLKSLEELAAYPVLAKDTYKQNRERMVPDTLGTIRYKTGSTGGTTGQPTPYHQDVELNNLRYGFMLWGWGLTGYRFGDPMAILAAGSLVASRQPLKNRVRMALERKLKLIGVTMDRAIAIDFHRQLREHGTTLIYGYPSIIAEFARHVGAAGLRLPRLRAVSTTSEMLLAHDKRAIEDNLGCPVFDHLGCNDGGFLAFECERHDGFHYNDLEAILETDGQTDGAGGPLLVTNLWNRSMPFVRYANGDEVTMGASGCACGRAFPIIATIQGRTLDSFAFANGRVMSGVSVQHVMRGIEMEGFQVVQRGPNRVELRVLDSAGRFDAEQEAFVRDIYRRHAGPEVAIDVRRVDALERTVNHKVKFVWVEFDEEGKREQAALAAEKSERQHATTP